MLGDKVPCTRVQRSREEGAHDEINERLGTEQIHQQSVKRDLRDDVDEVDRRKGHLVDEDRPDGVEENLERAEEGLAEHRVEHDGFDGRGQVGIEAVDAERLVMSEVVRLRRQDQSRVLDTHHDESSPETRHCTADQ